MSQHSAISVPSGSTERPVSEVHGKPIPVVDRRFRPELHGVRGLAILGVVLYHLFGDGRISGGIDIFLAVSGFLFTGMLLREAEAKNGLVDLFAYLARLVRRLLPPALVVIAATTAAGLMLFPSTRHGQLLAEAKASLLYVENLELIDSQLAYGAAGPETSPFQHFWSLSVQGQFYLVWPVVAMLSVLIARRLGRSSVAVMGGISGILIVLSLGYAMWMQSFDQDQAYLATVPRIWELAFGAVLALLGARASLPRRLRTPAGWIGVILIASCGLVLDGSQLFPGPWALWPLLGLALVMASTSADEPQGPPHGAGKVLCHPVFSFIGDVAYGLYLWHWPMLIFYLEIRDYDAVGPRGASVIFTAALLAAWLTHRLIERPVAGARRIRPWPQVVVAAAVVLIATLSVTSLQARVMPDLPDGYQMAGVDRSEYPGAAAFAEGKSVPQGMDPYPDFPTVSGLHHLYYYNEMKQQEPCLQHQTSGPGASEVEICEDPTPPENPTATVMISGGSHGGHWYGALSRLAEKFNWELLVAYQSACRFGTPERDACVEWNENFVSELDEWDVDLVIAPGTFLKGSGTMPTEHLQGGSEERWGQILDTGTELLTIRGTPRASEDVADCLASGGHAAECGSDAAQYQAENPLEGLEFGKQFHQIDMSDLFCQNGTCPGIIGNVVVYRDSNHMTPAYSETLTPYLEKRMRDRLPEYFSR